MHKRNHTSLGIYLGHDPSSCLVKNGKILAFIEEERLTRFKHGRPISAARLWPRFSGRFGYFPWASVCYCLESAGLGIDEIDVIAVSAEWSGDNIRSILPVKDRSKIIFSTDPKGGVHHFRHALSAFYASPFTEAVVLVVDDDGSVTDEGFEGESGYHFKNREGAYLEIFKNRYPPNSPIKSGLGWMYHAISEILGFIDPYVEVAEAGKTMGLSSYGKQSTEFKDSWVQFDEFKLDFSGFQNWVRQFGSFKMNKSLTKGKLSFNSARHIPKVAKNLSLKVQMELEKALLHLTERLFQTTKSRNLCLAGGVALNSVANGKISSSGIYNNLFIQPAAGDSGQAIGLAYYAYLSKFGSGILPIRHVFGGRSYSKKAGRALLQETNLPYECFPESERLVKDAAEEISRSRVIGWFQGGSEYGPRALGHRSILADPRSHKMKDYLNSEIKFREGFRPFAPSVLAHRVSEVFETNSKSPFMLIVASVRKAWRKRVPAITHVDGTARIHTVEKNIDPLYFNLISAFENKTGVPLLLNTSFNLKGMPIIETPWDALTCMFFTNLDVLYIGHFKIQSPNPFYLNPFWNPIWKMQHHSGTVKISCEQEGTKTIKMHAHPEIVYFLRTLNENRSLMEGIKDASKMRRLGSRTLSDLDYGNLVKRLLREGVLRLRVGSLVFPRIIGSDNKHGPIPSQALPLLWDEAGLLSSLSVYTNDGGP